MTGGGDDTVIWFADLSEMTVDELVAFSEWCSTHTGPVTRVGYDDSQPTTNGDSDGNMP